VDEDGTWVVDEAAAADTADAMDPTDPDRAADDGSDGDQGAEQHRGEPVVDGDDQEALIDAVLAEDEADTPPG